jgi:hypothetical protein
VGCDQFLLLAERAEEPERMRAETDEPEQEQGHERDGRGCQRAQSLATLGLREHEKREHDPGAGLCADPRHERGDSLAARTLCAERESARESQDHERVVVRAADGQYEQNRVQAHEGRSPHPRAAEALGCSGAQPHGRKAGENGDRLHRPQPAGDPEWGRGVARKREERSVG